MTFRACIIISILLFLLLLVGNSCKSTKEANVVEPIMQEQEGDNEIIDAVIYHDAKIEELPSDFFDKIWHHQYEEDKANLQYFRPAPEGDRPSFYRNKLFFRLDGSCQYLWLAPNDAHEVRDATWVYFPNKLYILENSGDIIDVYELYSITDSLLILKEKQTPLDIIYGRWNLVCSGDRDMKGLGYTIDIKGREVDIIKESILLNQFEMNHSLRRLQEPLALIFEEDISNKYPWISSGQYGIVHDTLIIEIDDNLQSKFIR